MRLAAAWSWLRAHPTEEAWRPTGLPLVAAGALAGLVGIAAVLYSQSVGNESFDMQRYVYREVAGAALALALPLFLGGASLSLPLRRVARIAVLSGGALALLGVGSFVWLYPFAWNVPGRDYSPVSVVSYAFGLSFMVAAVTSGLVAAYVEWREQRALAARAQRDDVTEEEVMRDLEDTTARSKLSWGGMRNDERALLLDADILEAAPLQGRIVGRTATIPAESFGTDVGALLAFRGIKPQATESYDEAPLEALKRLRAEQRQESAREPWWRRVLSWRPGR